MTARSAAWGLAAIAILAIAARSVRLQFVFVDGDVLIAMWDGSYHARLALYSFIEFPRILFSDPYLRFPEGAPVPMPLLYDWLLAAVARCFGSEVGVFERVAAWSSPALAAFALLPTYVLARDVRSRGVGLGAALLLALIPASTGRSSLGDPDHHAAVALLLIWALAAGAALLRHDLELWRKRTFELLLFLARTGIILVWSGSLLFVAIGEGAFVLASLFARRPEWLGMQARSSALSAMAIAPWVWAAPTPLSGPLTVTTLSWIHPLVLLAVAAVALGLAWLERAKPLPSAGASVARAATLVIVGCAVGLCVPAVREAAMQGLTFLTKTDTWGTRNVEQDPLFAWMPGAYGDHTVRTFGWWSYGIPLAPIVFLIARPIDLPVRVFLAVWSGCLGFLTISQVRFGSDFAPIACVAIALSLDQFRVQLATRVPKTLAWFSCIALGLVLTWTPIYGSLYPQIKKAQWLRELPHGVDKALYWGSSTLVRFAEAVRAHTPETSGYFDPDARPEYGILVEPGFGHVFSYAARRSTPSTGFGPYLDIDKYQATERFYHSTDASESISVFDSLGTRYVVTRSRRWRNKMVHLLHEQDGTSQDGMQYIGEFRLVIESPVGGTPLATAGLRSGAQVVPYKLFERVAGAVLEVRVPPSTDFSVALKLKTNTGRRFVFRARTKADATGVARLRVPYATDTEAATRALGLYRVKIGDDAPLFMSVGESDILAGTSIELSAASVHKSP